MQSANRRADLVKTANLRLKRKQAVPRCKCHTMLSKGAGRGMCVRVVCVGSIILCNYLNGWLSVRSNWKQMMMHLGFICECASAEQFQNMKWHCLIAMLWSGQSHVGVGLNKLGQQGKDMFVVISKTANESQMHSIIQSVIEAGVITGNIANILPNQIHAWAFMFNKF